MKISIYFAVIILFVSISNGQNKIFVPEDYTQIQSAIDESVDGDSIIVSPGTYFENINFRGKNIVLTSKFFIENDLALIKSTIINGSNPIHEDSASVVLFVSGEDSTAVIQGFSILGGRGTKTYNTAENTYFRTGGGILVDHASPTIMYNIIKENESINKSGGVTGAGGGGIRAGQSKANISNNIIAYNKGGYAGGVMLAYCNGMKFSNNIVAYNEAYEDFNGGGGIYIDFVGVPILNCTIVSNISGDEGGGIIITGAKNNQITNCIIYDNIASGSKDKQIFERFNGTPLITYSNIHGGWEGAGNIDVNPSFSEFSPYFLIDDSPCIDTGNPDPTFNDIEDLDNLGFPKAPAKGTLRNDMGAYGGPDALLIPYLRMFDYKDILNDKVINKTYFKPQLDTTLISSKITVPENQLIEAKVIIKNTTGMMVDSILMQDDGNLYDKIADDGIYTAAWPIPQTEVSFTADILIYLKDYEQFVNFGEVFNFTTLGPIKFDNFEFASNDTIPNPGDRIRLKLNLKNYGLTDTVKNVDVEIVLSDFSCMKNSTTGDPKFGDFAPGEIKGNTNRPFAIIFSDTCSTERDHLLELLISSNGIVYWKDTLTIDLLTDINTENNKLIKEYKLYQNYPNPFNPTTTIKYSIPSNTGYHKSNVNLVVYDILGGKVKTLVNDVKPAGEYVISFDADDLSSGVYYYHIKTENYYETKKMIILK